MSILVLATGGPLSGWLRTEPQVECSPSQSKTCRQRFTGISRYDQADARLSECIKAASALPAAPSYVAMVASCSWTQSLDCPMNLLQFW